MKYDKAKYGATQMVQAELDNARLKVKQHADGPARSYFLGVLDGLVTAASHCGWPTRKEKRKEIKG